VRLATEKSSCPRPQNLSQPRSSSTSITVSKPYCSSPTKHTAQSPTSCHPLTLLKTHSHRVPPLAPGTRKRLPRSGSLQVVVSKATATDSNEANFSSAVASDTTLGLMDNVSLDKDHRSILCPPLFNFRIAHHLPNGRFRTNSSTLCDKGAATLNRVRSDSADCALSAELAAAIVLQRHRTIVIMEACKLSSRRRAEWMACAVLPTPGIVG
jgi:hypothetical protein